MKVLVISPHPDDESIGCGGALCKHFAEGDSVEVIFLTSGERGGHGRMPGETSKIREQEAADAASILNLSNMEFWHQPDGQFNASEENIQRLLKKILEMKPAVIYTPHDNEEHPDHQAAALLVHNTLNQMNSSIKKPLVWMYEVWTPLQRLDHIVDITPYIDIKRRAIQAHKCQCAVLRFDEAALSLNRYRGEMHSWPGGDYAEVFKKMSF